MKKNFLTIIILALGILNMILTAVIVFAVVPTTMRTNNLISKVASTIDLELESPDANDPNQINIADIEVYQIPEDLTINLKQDPGDTKSHYALVSVSLSINTKSEDYKSLQPTIATNQSSITEIINDEFSKYTVSTVTENKDKIKSEILKKIQEHFKSDFIISISVGKLVVE
ncbi:flagellar basal body-associated protein FliL [Anaerocolumna sedimenticola]|uniref:Flagellar protein FliL n=1 Tax=Anaerocolumna sedimenticola TaxID=2696063 RepID=A0A6P1TNP3_9FIRM|nr:flagellar basal body-associated FliL family protein [Anaerocolumna sedimenticola]QHQ62083.1 flagellar basal body-associated protein FliL [Anaerocolumna sedimenticola]